MITKPFNLPGTPLRPGVRLLEANAGTGKTYTISGLFCRFVVEEGLDISKILVVTFTEAATEELKKRDRKYL
ncbi:MAG: UvrD-helicase domain-containing protein [Opitutae bacterium]|nr:UvrD-helicase domain-containing protein [Opitutae bacterium]